MFRLRLSDQSANLIHTGPFDLSSPLPPSPGNRAPPKAPSQNSQAEAPSRFRRVGGRSPQPREAPPRREAIGNARPAPGQLLRRTGNKASPSNIGRVKPQSHDEADVLRSNRTSLLSAPNGRGPTIRYTDQENQDVEEDEDELDFAHAEEEIAFLEQQLSEDSDNLEEKDVVLLESRLKLLTEDETLTPEQHSILEALSDEEVLSNMSEDEMNSSLERINAVTEQQLKEQREDMSDEDKEVESLTEYLSENADKLDDKQVIAMESRLKLLTEKDSLTEEQCSLLNSLNVEDMTNMSDGQINTALEQVNRLTDEQQKDPEAEKEKEVESLTDQLSDADTSDLSVNQIIAMESRLKLLAEDEDLTTEQRSLLTALGPGNIDNLSQEQIDTSLKRLNILTVKEDAAAFMHRQRSEGQSAVTDEERNLLTQLSENDDLCDEQRDSIQNRLKEIQARQLHLVKQLMDENYDNLTKDQEQSILRELNLVNQDGTLENPAEKYAGLLAAEHGVALEDENEDDDVKEDEPEENPDELSTDQEIDKYIDEVIDPSPIATEALPYMPKEHTTHELRLDWPNTPLSGLGLTESVMQKVTWLAKRLPHGYWTPRQIAERYEEGYMVRFNSEEEKETVLRLAAEMANNRAAKASERSGEEVQAGDMQFESLGERTDEKQRLTDSMTKGVYPVPGKQSNQVMEGVMRQLDNNATYRSEDAEKFKGRIERLIGMVGGRARAGAGEAGAKK